MARITKIVNFQVLVPRILPLELTPLNGFLNGFGKKSGSGRGKPEKYALDFQRFKMKKPNLSIGLFAEEERKTRLELAILAPCLECTSDFYNFLIVNTIKILQHGIMTGFCPVSVPKQSNKNN